MPNGVTVVILSSPEEKVPTSLHSDLLQQIRDRYTEYRITDFQFYTHGVIARMESQPKLKKK